MSKTILAVLAALMLSSGIAHADDLVSEGSLEVGHRLFTVNGQESARISENGRHG
jgi:hypothetical protein